MLFNIIYIVRSFDYLLSNPTDKKKPKHQLEFLYEFYGFKHLI